MICQEISLKAADFVMRLVFWPFASVGLKAWSSGFVPVYWVSLAWKLPQSQEQSELPALPWSCWPPPDLFTDFPKSPIFIRPFQTCPVSFHYASTKRKHIKFLSNFYNFREKSLSKVALKLIYFCLGKATFAWNKNERSAFTSEHEILDLQVSMDYLSRGHFTGILGQSSNIPTKTGW